MNIKSVIYSGKFGDGLTAEYFRMRVECNRMPGLFGKLPRTVKVDPNVDFKGDFKAPFNEYAIRWTGKILIQKTGTYVFSLGADDGAWLALDGVTLIDNGACERVRHGRSGYKEISASTDLDKGGHEIAVLYYNRGPAGKAGKNLPGRVQLKYKGEDTNGQMQLVP